MDLFISPDSFSKYICLCKNVPAIILCTELSYIGAEKMIKTCFRDIYNNDNFKLLGLEPNLVDNINKIPIEDILECIQWTLSV